MISQTNTWLSTALGAAMILSVPLAPAIGGDNWGFSIGNGGFGFGISDNNHHGRHGGYGRYGGYNGYGGNYYGSGGYYNNYYQPRAYYPQYNTYPNYQPYNPVVRREVISGAEYAPDGTVHEQTTVEDRHSSSYAPGRNTAITTPRTTTTRVYGPDGTWVNREHTSWIGADGRPHSTTVDQETTQDVWGNTYTETDVTLKGKKTNQDSQNQSEDPVKVQDPVQLKTIKR